MYDNSQCWKSPATEKFSNHRKPCNLSSALYSSKNDAVVLIHI